MDLDIVSHCTIAPTPFLAVCFKIAEYKNFPPKPLTCKPLPLSNPFTGFSDLPLQNRDLEIPLP